MLKKKVFTQTPFTLSNQGDSDLFKRKIDQPEVTLCRLTPNLYIVRTIK